MLAYGQATYDKQAYEDSVSAVVRQVLAPSAIDRFHHVLGGSRWAGRVPGSLAK
jgi:hypothetical protein